MGINFLIYRNLEVNIASYARIILGKKVRNQFGADWSVKTLIYSYLFWNIKEKLCTFFPIQNHKNYYFAISLISYY